VLAVHCDSIDPYGEATLALNTLDSAVLSEPILCGGETFATLAFSALTPGPHRVFSNSDRQVLRLMARSLALIVEQRQLAGRLVFQARHDPLTGLPNRTYFQELLETALAERSGSKTVLSVLFIDLDRFKQINDTLGHSSGDRVLREVGGRLRQLLGPGDYAGRMGGDEFALVLAARADEVAATRDALALLDALRQPHSIDCNELFVTPSIGMAFSPRHGRSAAQLLHHADSAMCRAKYEGKNELRAFVAEDQGPALERLRLETSLRRALENGEFSLRYQPVYNVDGKLDGLEALLAWKHPIFGNVPPKEFIPIAEETGIILSIGSWALKQACLDGARWQHAGHHSARISVNVSALQFERRDFVETVAEALALSDFPSQCLELELTESYVMRDLHESLPRMARIRDLGVSISIDDFGTGYSSLSYLNRLPVDSLKIDQSFLRNLQEPEGSLPVVHSIVRLAHSMNLTVVAEGVETREELDLVRVLGCDKVQGHVYGAPMSPLEVERLLDEQRANTMAAAL